MDKLIVLFIAFLSFLLVFNSLIELENNPYQTIQNNKSSQSQIKSQSQSHLESQSQPQLQPVLKLRYVKLIDCKHSSNIKCIEYSLLFNNLVDQVKNMELKQFLKNKVNTVVQYVSSNYVMCGNSTLESSPTPESKISRFFITGSIVIATIVFTWKIRDLYFCILSFKISSMNKYTDRKRQPTNPQHIDEREMVYNRNQIDRLGKGCFGMVIKAKYHGANVAVKIAEDNDVFTFNDAKCHTKVNGHKNILDIYGYYGFETENPSFVLELMDCNLKDFLVNYKSNFGRAPFLLFKIIYEVVEGLEHMHSCNVLHGDIHMGNILVKGTKSLLDPFEVKICDFGVSKDLFNDYLGHTKALGYNRYMPPEVVMKGREYYSKEDDIYSLGIVIWFMFTLVCGNQQDRLKMEMFECHDTPVIDPSIFPNPELYHLVSRCIGPKYCRPSIKELKTSIAMMSSN